MPAATTGAPAGDAELAATTPAGPRGRPLPQAWWAGMAHAASLLAAFAFWLSLGRGLWFFQDDWDFLERRGLGYAPGNQRSLWFAHNEHWSTLPILLWRALYSVFALGTYWPYLVCLLLVQLAVMHLIWRWCRRAGCDPWVAFAAAALVGLMGAGASDFLSAFQVTFVGSVMFGLIAIDLIERVDQRRDVAASLALLASLMCSTVGDAMVAGTAVLLFARRPARRAAVVLALPVASYAIWFAFLGRPSVSAPTDHFTFSTLSTLPGYIWFGLSTGLGTTFNYVDAGAAILVGLAAWVIWHMRALWQEAPSALGLCAASVCFWALAGLGRDTTAGASTAVISRYVFVGTAVLLPVIAKLLSSASAHPAARLTVVTVLLGTVLGNIGQAQTAATASVAQETTLKVALAGAARLLAQGVPDVSGPDAPPVGLYPSLSAATVARLYRSGVLPRLAVSPVDLANSRALLALGTWNGRRTALLDHPLFRGRFRVVNTIDGIVARQGPGCVSVAPETLSPAMQVWLRMAPGPSSASVELSAAPASPGLTNYVGALLVPYSGPAAHAPVQLVVPNNGTGYLSDDDNRAEVVLIWDIGTPLLLCGLAGAGG